MNNLVRFPAIQVTQPIGTFYIGVIDSADLIEISFADVRRIEDREMERVVGIQRPLAEERVKELQQYVNTVDATFPTSIILAVEAKHAEYDPESKTLSLARNDEVAKIIDGQHRIAGLQSYHGPPFQLNVTVFVDMDMEEQALVFATINLKQTKVSKSLAYDLTEYFKSRSPQKTAHEIAKLLNSKKGSPFFQKIKILGRADDQRETITQAAFVDRLLRYLSTDTMGDRDKLKRGGTLEPTPEDERKLIFRNLFIEDRDAEIARIVWNFFEAVSRRWPRAWNEVDRGRILNRTTGLEALMRFLRVAYVESRAEGVMVETDQFEDILRRIGLDDDDFSPSQFAPGGSGPAELYRSLLEQSGLTGV